MRIKVEVDQKEAFRRGYGSAREMVLDFSDGDIASLSGDDRRLIARDLILRWNVDYTDGSSDWKDGDWDAIIQTGIPMPSLEGIVEALREKERGDEEANEWINKFGSGDLKKWVAAGLPRSESTYDSERLELEYPGWGWPEWGCPATYDNVEDAIDDLSNARKSIPHATVEHHRFKDGETETLIVAKFMGDTIYYLGGQSSKENASEA